MRIKDPNWQLHTKLVQTSIQPSSNKESATALYTTSGYIFDSPEEAEAIFAKKIPGNSYGRYHNPNNHELIAKFLELEQAESGLTTASGMAAIFAILASYLKQGDTLITGSCLFGSSMQIAAKILPEWGVEHKICDSHHEDDWEVLLKNSSGRILVLIETPTNPLLSVYDIAMIAKITHAYSGLVVVDNVYATPLLQQPLVLGADIVMHSLTKYADGQGRVLGGIILGAKTLLEPIEFFLRHTGAHMSPFQAWVISKSLETFALRMRNHFENTEKVYDYLLGVEAIEEIFYPFSTKNKAIAAKQMSRAGAMLSIQLKGGKNQAFLFLQALQLFRISANLGDTRSIAVHPATTTHSSISQEMRDSMGISDSLIRLSIGIEAVEDIIQDLQQAFAKL